MTLLRLLLILLLSSAAFAQDTTVTLFRAAAVQFLPDSTKPKDDNGRTISASVTLPRFAVPVRIHAHIVIQPVAKDERTVCDRWDRAGNLRLAVNGQPDLEIVRFMTSYGGRTEHDVDVSFLAPVLQGPRTVRFFIDTWTSPAWTVDAELRYTPDTTYSSPDWVLPVYYTDSFNRQDMPQGVKVPVTLPAGLARVVMIYFSTGHCTDGTDADEFISKANVISVDGRVAARVHPWRTDCRQYRDRNPYTSHWTDGSWSSDYSRSGWCPGCEVTPQEFDLTDHLTAGRHTLGFAIENMRPRDDKGQFGYWRVSGYLVGWKTLPELWKN
jgi:hypothetical protein